MLFDVLLDIRSKVRRGQSRKEKKKRGMNDPQNMIGSPDFATYNKFLTALIQMRCFTDNSRPAHGSTQGHVLTP